MLSSLKNHGNPHDRQPPPSVVRLQVAPDGEIRYCCQDYEK